MIRFIITSLLLVGQPRLLRIDPILDEFNNLITLAGVTALILPKIRFRNSGNQPCQEDKDCRGNKKCCELYFQKFCCDPEKYVKVKPNIGY